jgi:hypothetical protein
MEKKLTVNGNDYNFERTELYFEPDVYKNVFAEKNNKTLHETIDAKRYIHLKEYVYRNYKNQLNIPLGLFLKQLKDNDDLFYKEFLNDHGDAVYSKFRIIDRKYLLEKGLYIYCINDELKYIGRSKDPFGKRINNGYGNISPKNCYLDGQSTNCHINSLITKYRRETTLFLSPLKNDTIIVQVEIDLINKYSPEWNIQLK